MADPVSTLWPLPKFYFSVKWGGTVMQFQEVSGLNMQSEEIKYRAGDSKLFSVTKMPGLVKYDNVTMKKGTFKGDISFADWFMKIKMNTIERSTVIISLLDETGKESIIWTLENAWPTKVSSTDLKSEDNAAAIESIEIVHERLTITKG